MALESQPTTASEDGTSSRPQAWLLRRLHLERGEIVRPILRFFVGWGGVAIPAIVSYFLAQYFVSQMEQSDNSSTTGNNLFQACATLLICGAMTAFSLLCLISLLRPRRLTWGVLLFASVAAFLYLFPATWKIYLVKFFTSANLPQMGNPWWEWKRILMTSGFPFAWFVCGLLLVVVTLRFLSKQVFTTNDISNPQLHSKPISTRETVMLFPLLAGLFACVNIFFRGSWGIIHSFIFAFAGILCGLFVYACLRLLAFRSFGRYAWILRLVVVAYMFAFVLLTTFLGFSDSYFTVAVTCLPIVVGATILEADWLRASGWRLAKSQPSQRPLNGADLSSPAWQTAYVGMNCFLGCVFLWIGIQYQVALHQSQPSVTSFQPWLLVASAHLILVYAICTRSVWFWAAHILVAIAWMPMLGLNSRPHPTVLLLIIVLCVGHLVAFYLLLKRRQVWLESNEFGRLSLAQATVITTLLGVAIGMDVRAPKVAKQSWANAKQSREQAERLVKEIPERFVQAIQSGQLTESFIEQELGHWNNMSTKFKNELLQHSDPRVRIETVRMLGRLEHSDSSRMRPACVPANR